jgi:UDP-2,3-diacylglucosamine hydrolase
VRKLGLIAGNGVFPLEVAAAARRRRIQVAALAHRGETEPAIESLCDKVTWVRVGELQTIIDVLRSASVECAAMAGGISRARLAASFAPDARALSVLARLAGTGDDAVLRAVATEIESEGIEIIDPVPLLDGALAQAGRMAGPEPSAAQLRDLTLAFAVMRTLGDFDIGQAVGVRNELVAAIEAIEGTDAALRRAAALCGKGIVVAKAVKPRQDLRFDRPAIGPATMDLLHEIGAAVLGAEAGKTLILEVSRTLALADEYGVTLYGYA